MKPIQKEALLWEKPKSTRIWCIWFLSGLNIETPLVNLNNITRMVSSVGTNNTPARVDKNELYLDVAIEPVKAIEFIYIPLRIKNTGEIASLG